MDRSQPELLKKWSTLPVQSSSVELQVFVFHSCHIRVQLFPFIPIGPTFVESPNYMTQKFLKNIFHHQIISAMGSALSPHLKVNLIDSPLSRWKITNSYSEHIKSMTAVFSGFRVNTPPASSAETNSKSIWWWKAIHIQQDSIAGWKYYTNCNPRLFTFPFRFVVRWSFERFASICFHYFYSSWTFFFLVHHFYMPSITKQIMCRFFSPKKRLIRRERSVKERS